MKISSESTDRIPRAGLTSGAPTAFDSRPMRVEEIDEDGLLVIRAELPDVDIEGDLDVQVRNQLLEIRATRTPPKTASDSARHSEFRYGRFWRVLTLPDGAREADIMATYKQGILEVRVPLTAAQPAEGRRIVVRHALP